MHENRDPAIRLFGQKIPFPEDVDIEEEEEDDDDDEGCDGRDQEIEEDKVRFVVSQKIFRIKATFFVTYTQHPFLLMLKPLMGPFCLFVFPLFAHINNLPPYSSAF